MPICISNPSAVSRRGSAMTPALLSSTSRRECFALNAAAAARTEARLARSSARASTFAPGVSERIARSASSAALGLRHASTTSAFFAASARAASKPSPLFAPVIRMVRPVRSGMSFVLHAAAMILLLERADVSPHTSRLSCPTSSSRRSIRYAREIRRSPAWPAGGARRSTRAPRARRCPPPSPTPPGHRPPRGGR